MPRALSHQRPKISVAKLSDAVMIMSNDEFIIISSAMFSQEHVNFHESHFFHCNDCLAMDYNDHNIIGSDRTSSLRDW